MSETTYKRMRARGKPQNVAVVAMARELVGFVWAIAQRLASGSGATGEIPSTPSPSASALEVQGCRPMPTATELQGSSPPSA